MSDETNHIIVIEGITEAGKLFRPSDWAERISGNLSTFEHHRMHYSPLLRPSVWQGNKCLLLDEQLENKHPGLYKQIMNFVHKNKLKVHTMSAKN